MKQILTGFLLIMSHVVAIAQSKTTIDSLTKMGTISGCVTTTDGDTVIGAQVALEQGGMARAGTMTNFNGIYYINGLLPGKYDLNILYQGIKEMRISNIEVKAGDTTVANIQAEYRQLFVEFMCTGMGPKLVDPDKPSTNKKFSAEQIEQMAW